MVTINGAALTTFEVAADGGTVSINVAAADSTPGSLVLPTECLQAMIMTLPGMMQQALRRRHRDPSLKLVFPVGDWRLETSTQPGALILTLATNDGFSVSFAADAALLADIARTANDATLCEPFRPN